MSDTIKFAWAILVTAGAIIATGGAIYLILKDLARALGSMPGQISSFVLRTSVMPEDPLKLTPRKLAILDHLFRKTISILVAGMLWDLAMEAWKMNPR